MSIDVRLLSITNRNLYYGSTHDGTFTVEKERVLDLKALLEDSRRQLLELTNQNPDEDIFETTEALYAMLEHIDEYLGIEGEDE